jgi:dCMP deaminase
MKKRKSWDQYFLDIAKMVATRSTCDRLHVGAVIVKDNRIISTGYNGSIPGAPHCSEVGCDIIDSHCVAVVHSECNAIASAAKSGISIKDSILYCTHLPCFNCFKLIASAGIAKIVYRQVYKANPLTEKYIGLIGGTHYQKELENE